MHRSFSQNRKKLKEKFGNPYIKLELPSLEEEKCFYCGEWATQTDHVPPISHLGDFKLGFLIPSCSECNALLNDRRCDTLKERCNYIKSKLRKRYNKIFNIVPWSEDEINELEGRLKEYISDYNNSAKIVVERLNYHSSVYDVYADMKLYCVQNIENKAI